MPLSEGQSERQPGTTPGWFERIAGRANHAYWFLPLGVFIAGLAATAVVGVAAYGAAKRPVLAYVDLDLRTVTRLKADQISHWLEEVEDGIEFDSQRLRLTEAILRWRGNALYTEAARDDLTVLMSKICAAGQLVECSLQRPGDGALWLSNGFGSDLPSIRKQAVLAAADNDARLEDLYVDHRANPSRPLMGYFFAVRRGTPPFDSIGVLHATVDPTGLFRIVTEGSPQLAKSLESALLGSDGSRLNDLEGLAAPDASRPTPPPINRLALQNAGRMVAGLDARSTPVFAYAAPIPGTGWFVMTKVDRAEAFATLDAVTMTTAAAAASVLLVCCAAWAVRRRDMVKSQHDRTQRLMLTRRIDYLARYASDGIILSDERGRILEVNDRCASVYGYGPGEMVGMNVAELTGSGQSERPPDLFKRLRLLGALLFESEHRRKDGSTIPVEVSATVIDAEGDHVQQTIVRDISARRSAEAERTQGALRLRELSRRLLSAQEQERRRISAELHDGILGNLAAVKVNLSTLDRWMGSDRHDPEESLLAETTALVGETVEQIRRLCADLRPPLLDQKGLRAALESSARRFALCTHAVVAVNAESLRDRLSPEVESMFFRIAQEALANSARHARAERVDIFLGRVADRIELVIADDGVGFDPQTQTPAGTGLGLDTMRERAEFAGARFELVSTPGQGTRIRVSLEARDAIRDT